MLDLLRDTSVAQAISLSSRPWHRLERDCVEVSDVDLVGAAGLFEVAESLEVLVESSDFLFDRRLQVITAGRVSPHNVAAAVRA